MPRVKPHPPPSCNKTGNFCFERKYEYKGGLFQTAEQFPVLLYTAAINVARAKRAALLKPGTTFNF